MAFHKGAPNMWPVATYCHLLPMLISGMPLIPEIYCRSCCCPSQEQGRPPMDNESGTAQGPKRSIKEPLPEGSAVSLVTFDKKGPSQTLGKFRPCLRRRKFKMRPKLGQIRENYSRLSAKNKNRSQGTEMCYQQISLLVLP